ncbi:putative retrotransposon gag domain-containing protein [Helianthus annuus]|nr:putative retrotransposon gag domain-containing protein [Helianthus annuus]
MANPNGENSHTSEDEYDNAQVHLTGAQLKALVDNAVQAALDRQYTESRSRTVSKPPSKPKAHSKSHSKPLSKPLSKPKKDDDNHSSNENSVRREREYTDASRARGCTYKYFVSCKPRDFTGEKGAVDCMTWLDEMDTVVDISGCAERDVVKFVSQSFKGEALAWWRALVQASGKTVLYSMTWEEFITLIKENYCPQHEVEKIESDFVSLVMTNLDCQAYLTSFNTMSRLVPYLVTPEPRRIARFIGGLEPAIKASVKASRPTTFRPRRGSVRMIPHEGRERSTVGTVMAREGQSRGKMGNNPERSPSAKTARNSTLGNVGLGRTHSPSRSRILVDCASPRTTRLWTARRLKMRPAITAMRRGTLKVAAPNSPRRQKKPKRIMLESSRWM